MKTILILILMALLNSCNSTGNEKTISIIQNWDSSNSSDNIENHKDKEVNILRMHNRDKDGKFYFIFMYRMDDKKLRAYPFPTSAKSDYDKASYKWINDTTMLFSLRNSLNNLSETFKMTGNGDRIRFSRQ
jgi:hypothetical protein